MKPANKKKPALIMSQKETRCFIWAAPEITTNRVFLAPTEADDTTSTLAAGTRWFWNTDETVISFKQVKSKWQHSNCSIPIIKCTNSTKPNCRKGITNMLRNFRKENPVFRFLSVKLIEFLEDRNDSLTVTVMFFPPQNNSLLSSTFVSFL